MLSVQFIRLLLQYTPLVLETLLALVVYFSLEHVSLGLELVNNLVPYLVDYLPLLSQQHMLLLPCSLLNIK